MIAPRHSLYAGVEIACHSPHLHVGKRHHKQLYVVHIRNLPLCHILAYSAKRLGRTGHHRALAVGRKLRIRHKTIVGADGVGAHVIEVQYHDSAQACWALGKAGAMNRHQQALTIG